MNMGYTAIFLLPVEPYLHRWILRKHIMRIFYIIYILSFSVKKKNPFVRRYWLLFLCLKNMVESSRVFEEFHSKYDASVVLFSTCWVMTAFFVCGMLWPNWMIVMTLWCECNILFNKEPFYYSKTIHIQNTIFWIINAEYYFHSHTETGYVLCFLHLVCTKMHNSRDVLINICKYITNNKKNAKLPFWL